MTKKNLLAAASLLLLLTGCSFSKGETQQNYVLEAPLISEQLQGKQIDVVVMPVEVASGLDTARVAFIEDKVRMNYLAGAKWAEPLPQMLQYVWIDALRKNHVVSSASSNSAGIKPDRAIVISANAFQAEKKDDGHFVIHIAYEAKETSALSHTVLAVAETTVYLPVAGTNQTDVMDAFNAANQEAIHNLLVKLADRMKS